MGGRSRSPSPRSPQEIDVEFPPSSALRDASVSSERSRHCPPHRLAARQHLHLHIENRFRLNPAGDPLQGAKNESRLIPLVEYFDAWKNLTNISSWVLRTIQKGYRLQFGSRPLKFNGVVRTVVNPEQSRVLEQEVSSLLVKEAIERIPPPDRESGLRPIIDLRHLNQSLRRFRFKMHTIPISS